MMNFSWCAVILILCYSELTTAFLYGGKKQNNEKECPKYKELTKPKFDSNHYRLSEAKCFEYVFEMIARENKATWNSKCKRKVFVIRGTRTKPAEYSHMGALGWWVPEEEEWQFMCASSLISTNFVLTAAHCFISSGKVFGRIAKPTIVRLGVRNIKKSLLEVPMDIEIEKYFVHPKFKPPQKYYDVALFKLKKNVEFTKFVQPACLWSEKNLKKNTSITVTGWGSASVGSQSSAHLLAAEIDIIDTKTCNHLLHRYRNRHWSFGLQDHQLCAGKLQGGADTCQGDSGGPLQFKLANTKKEGQIHAVLGITSFGFKCGMSNLPGIYTKVASFLDWIERIVWSNEYQSFYDI